jgi:hypothetical protein
MTPTEEARFIALWQAGIPSAAMGRTLGLPRGTVASRAYHLVRQGKIAARPKGGHYPLQQRRRRQEETPAPHASPATPAPPTAERKDIQQWTIRLSKALIEHIKAVAYERRIPPSQLLEEWLWHQAYHDKSPDSTSS